ncbi:hypothetical protein G7046_g9196 [Stylonectria norvegica]|nr:hypothetical protein G7046_g9196 [Stylonectria norvegica]
MHNPTLFATFTAVLAALPATQAAIYTKNSPVLQLNTRSYEKLIANSNYTSIVEFYAPWCGHCQNLKPAYEKAAEKLDGLAKVAAVDCDDDVNKEFCSALGVKGFPTLKVVRPSKMKGGKPVVEDYNGPRTANGIVESVVSKINNHVTRVTDKDLDTFLEGEKPKAILFTEKGTTSALLRSIAIEFLDVISVGQVRDKDTAAVKKFGVEKFPTLVLVPGQDQEPKVYGGELNKKDMVAFLSQAGDPNQDPAPATSKSDKKTKSDKKKDKKSKPAKSAEVPEEKTSAEPEASSEAPTADASAENAAPSEPPILTIATEEELSQHCLNPKSHTCLMVLVPSELSETTVKAVEALSRLSTKYVQAKRHLFPIFAVPAESEAASALTKSLELNGDINVVALNSRRAWWRHYEGDFSYASIDNWIDAIRMGDGAKNKLPKDIVDQTAQSSTEASSSAAPTQATDPEPEVETEAPEATETEVPQVEEETTESEVETEATRAADAEPEAETEAPEAAETEVPVVEVEEEATESEAEVKTKVPEAEEKIVHEEL